MLCCIACTLCACKKKNLPPVDDAPIVLVNFPATATEEATLGSEYRLKIKSVKDENGKEYTVSAVVTDSAQKPVTLINGDAFQVTDKDGYVIVYTAATGTTPQTQTLTISVKDEEKPTIVISAPQEGTVGTEYVLPDIAISDLSGSVADSSVKLYYVGESDERVDFTEQEGVRKFTPTKAGTYKIVAYARDAANNDRTDEKTFTVDVAIAANAIYDPASVKAKERLTADTQIDTQIVTAGAVLILFFRATKRSLLGLIFASDPFTSFHTTKVTIT